MNCTLLGFEIGMAAHAFQHSHDPLFAILLGVHVAAAFITLTRK